MSFPIPSFNGQTTIQNGITYIYSTSTNSWRRDYNNVLDRLFLGGLYPSTSTTNGALIVLGGVGIGGNLNVGGGTVLGGSLFANGTVHLSPPAGDVFIEPTLNGTVVIYPSLTGAIDNMIIGGTLPRIGYFTDVIVEDLANAHASTGSGALQVAGGASVAKDLYVGGRIFASEIVSSSSTWLYTSTNTVSAGGTKWFVNTSATTVTMTLPLLPSVGDSVEFIDYSGTFGTNNLIFARNGEKIMGLAEDLIINLDFAANTMIYSGVTQGWKIGVIF
jgi:hypothetical protein